MNIITENKRLGFLMNNQFHLFFHKNLFLCRFIKSVYYIAVHKNSMADYLEKLTNKSCD